MISLGIVSYTKNHNDILNLNFRDPNLWVVKCRMGEEKATAISLMRKFIAYQFTDEVRLLTILVLYFVCKNSNS